MVIGDYIHFHYENYLRYGNTKNTSQGNVLGQLNHAFQKQRQQLYALVQNKKRLNDKEAIRKQLEKSLNFFFARTADEYLSYGYSVEEAENLQKLIMATLQKKIGGADIYIDPNTLAAYATGSKTYAESFAALVSKYASNPLGGKSQNKTTYQAVIERLETLIEMRKTLAKDSNKFNNFFNKLQAFESQYNKSMEKILEDLRQEQMLLADQGKQNYYYYLTDNDRGFLAGIQDLFVSVRQRSLNTVQGDIGEHMAVITQVLQEKIAEGALDIMTDVNEYFANTNLIVDIFKTVDVRVKGRDSSAKGVRAGAIINKRGGRTGSEFATIGDIEIEKKYTPDKVDIQLKLPTNELINASVKNVRLGSNMTNAIHILRGTSILKLVQDYPEFTNHYLNITANNRWRSSLEDINFIEPDKGTLYKAHRMMKLAIGLHALAGGVWGLTKEGVYKHSDIGEVFVVNNVSSPGYKVYFMDDILRAIEKDIDLLDIKNFNKVKEWNNIWIDYDAAKGAGGFVLGYKRAARILEELHAFHLEVSVSPKVLV